MKNRTVEILAPAGSYESMVAAVNAGAEIINDVWGMQKDPDMARVAGSISAEAGSVPVPTRTTWMRRRW